MDAFPSHKHKYTQKPQPSQTREGKPRHQKENRKTNETAAQDQILQQACIDCQSLGSALNDMNILSHSAADCKIIPSWIQGAPV